MLTLAGALLCSLSCGVVILDKDFLQLAVERDDTSQINSLALNFSYDVFKVVSALANRSISLQVYRDRPAANDDDAQREDCNEALDKLATDKALPVGKAISETRKHLERVAEMMNQTTGCRERLLALSSTLQAQLKALKWRAKEEGLNRMLMSFQSQINETDWSEEQKEKLDRMAVVIQVVIETLKDGEAVSQAKSALSAYKTLAGVKFREQMLKSIGAAIRSKVYTMRDEALLANYVSKLNQLQSEDDEDVEAMKREIASLSEAIVTLDSANEVIESKHNETEVHVVAKIAQILEAEMKNLKNEPMKVQANETLSKLNQMITAELMKVLDQVNQTLHDAGGYGGGTGLELIERKLQNVIAASGSSEQVRERSEALVSIVKSHQRRITEIFDVFVEIEENVRATPNDTQLKRLKWKLEQVESEFEEELKQPEVRQRFDEVSRQVEDLMAIKRKQPPPKKVRTKQEEARVLQKILSDNLRHSLHDMESRFERISAGIGNSSDSIKDRMAIVEKEFKTVASGVDSIINGLISLNLTSPAPDSVDVEPASKLQSIADTMKALSSLHGLLDNAKAQALLRKAFTITQSAGHANDTLKQLEKMVAFNTKHSSPESGATAVTEKPIKHVIVPTKRVNLIPPTRGGPGEKN